MAAKKKTNTSASTEPPASAEAWASADNTLVTTNDTGTKNREDNSEDTSVDDLADGEFEVELLNMGVSSEDIQAMRESTRASQSAYAMLGRQQPRPVHQPQQS